MFAGHLGATVRIRGAWVVLFGALSCKAEPGPSKETAPAAALEAAIPPAASPKPPAPKPPVPKAAKAGEAAAAEAAAAEAAAAEAALVDGLAPPDPPPPSVPTEPYRVLILGGSLAATGFGALLERGLDAHPHVKAYRKAKSASGLARPDFYDWMAEGRRQMELRKPDMVIVIMGGNDGQDLRAGKKGTKPIRWQSNEWAAAYRQRVDEFLHTLAADDGNILWLGLPRTNTRRYEAKLDLLRGIHEAAVTDLGEAGHYLDTSSWLEDRDGNLRREVQMGKRGPQRLRMDDGIHFTMAGSRFLANAVHPEVLARLGLEVVRD